jgi:AraC-like DNA-binding protein
MTDETIIPDRRQELADRSYRMMHYTWFRVIGKLPGLSCPYYLGRGVAFSPNYNIRDVWQAPMPDHVVLKIALSAGGSISTSPNHQQRLVKPGEVILRFVQDTDFWESYYAGHRGNWEFIGMILTGGVAAQTARTLINQFGRIYDLGRDHPIIKQLCQVVTEPNHVTEIAASSAFRLCNDLFSAMLDVGETSMSDRSGQIVNLAESVESTIRRDLKRDWSVDELAERHGISREHLTRIFTRRFGIPPRRYLTELRIQEACRRLRTTSESVKSIVMGLGFQSHANFIRTFKRFNNLSPTQYRQRQFDLSPETEPE